VSKFCLSLVYRTGLCFPDVVNSLTDAGNEFRTQRILNTTLPEHAANLTPFPQSGGALGVGGDWARHELFTSERSTRNLYLYQKLGYHTFRAERLTAKVTFVYLEKINLLSDSA